MSSISRVSGLCPLKSRYGARMTERPEPSERRYFTLDGHCSSALAGGVLLADAAAWSAARPVHSTLDSLGHRPDAQSLEGSGGSDEVQAARAKFRGLMEIVHEELATIADAGIEVKRPGQRAVRLWSITRRAGREVYLCYASGGPHRVLSRSPSRLCRA